MLFTKKYCYRNRWYSVHLKDKDFEHLFKIHREHCLSIWKECVEDAKEIMKSERRDLTLIYSVAREFFVKRTFQLYTVIEATLDEIVENEIARREADIQKLTNEKIKSDEEFDYESHG